MTYQLVELGNINPILTYFYQLARQICRIRGAKPRIASLQYPNIQTIITRFEKIQTTGYNGSSTTHIDANVLLSQKELFRKYFDGSSFASNSAKI